MPPHGATILPFMGTQTLTPHIREYLRGRVARGEITRQTSTDLGYCLNGFAVSFGRRPLDRLGPAAIDRWLESIGSYAPATRREYVSRVRTFCRWMVAQRRIPRDPTSHVPTIRQPRRVPVTFTEADIAALLAATCDRRAVAVIWLMVGCGCRCVEVARAQLADYDPIARTLILIGKGSHQRIVPVPEQVAAALDAYLDDVGRVSGPLIRNRLGDGRGALSSRTLSHYVRRWMRVAGVKTAVLDGRSAHGLRRTAGSDVMDRSGDIRIVQAMLGHSRVETTAKYYLRPVPLEQMREAMEGRDYRSHAA